jgi:hypothetical protein
MSQEQATLLQLQNNEQAMRLLLATIYERIDNGMTPCPLCGTRGSWAHSKVAVHPPHCALANLMAQIDA